MRDRGRRARGETFHKYRNRDRHGGIVSWIIVGRLAERIPAKSPGQNRKYRADSFRDRFTGPGCGPGTIRWGNELLAISRLIARGLRYENLSRRAFLNRARSALIRIRSI